VGGSPAVQVRLFWNPQGRLPPEGAEPYDLMLCAVPRSRPWVWVESPDATRQAIDDVLTRAPHAVQHTLTLLRRSEHGSLRAALERESRAYSRLLGGAAFQAWRARMPVQPPRVPVTEPVRFERADDAVTLFLSDPVRLNAWSTAMRDALVDALDTCQMDPTRPDVTLRGDGRAFCSGGALDEFGSAQDLQLAHRVRMQQSVAWRLARLGRRARVVLHGPTVGSGVEMAAAAAHVEAAPGTTLRLPELRMGLLPGAGGTVTVARRIGRHRLAWWLLTGRDIDAALALDWGMVDAIEHGEVSVVAAAEAPV